MGQISAIIYAAPESHLTGNQHHRERRGHHHNAGASVASKIMIDRGVQGAFGQRVGFAALRVFGKFSKPPCSNAALAAPPRRAVMVV
jgi:hypothetical protein